MWNAAYTPTGQSATVRNAGYNAVIAGNGGSQSFGFNGTYSGTNLRPTGFSFNGAACTVAP